MSLALAHAIAVDREIPTPVTVRRGGEGHGAILGRCDPLQAQWEKLWQSSEHKTRGKR